MYNVLFSLGNCNSGIFFDGEMKSAIFLIFFLSLSVTSACEAQETTQSPQNSLQSVVDSAREAFNAYTSLIKASEFTKAADYYANDHRFIWVEDGSIKYDTKAQVQRAFEGIGSLGEVENSFGAIKVWALNENQAMVFSRFRTTIGKGTQKEHSYTGAITIVMENGEAGWKFISGHTSSTPASKGF